MSSVEKEAGSKNCWKGKRFCKNGLLLNKYVLVCTAIQKAVKELVFLG
jgi:hypothetical protein